MISELTLKKLCVIQFPHPLNFYINTLQVDIECFEVRH